LNKVQQEDLFVELVNILIILVCILNVFILRELHQNIIPYVIIECTYEKYIIFGVSNDKMGLSDWIAMQDLFSLSINASICIPHVKDLSIFIPKTICPKYFEFVYLNIQFGYLSFYYSYFKTV
jgi:hypothetical protein